MPQKETNAAPAAGTPAPPPAYGRRRLPKPTSPSGHGECSSTAEHRRPRGAGPGRLRPGVRTPPGSSALSPADTRPVIVLTLILETALKGAGDVLRDPDQPRAGLNTTTACSKAQRVTARKGLIGIKRVNEQTGTEVGPGLAFGRTCVHITRHARGRRRMGVDVGEQKRQTLRDKILTQIVIAAPKPGPALSDHLSPPTFRRPGALGAGLMCYGNLRAGPPQVKRSRTGCWWPGIALAVASARGRSSSRRLDGDTVAGTQAVRRTKDGNRSPQNCGRPCPRSARFVVGTVPFCCSQRWVAGMKQGQPRRDRRMMWRAARSVGGHLAGTSRRQFWSRAAINVAVLLPWFRPPDRFRHPVRHPSAVDRGPGRFRPVKATRKTWSSGDVRREAASSCAVGLRMVGLSAVAGRLRDPGGAAGLRKSGTRKVPRISGAHPPHWGPCLFSQRTGPARVGARSADRGARLACRPARAQGHGKAPRSTGHRGRCRIAVGGDRDS